MMVKKAVDRYLKDKSLFSALFNPLNAHSGKRWFSLKHHFVGWQLCVNVDVLLEGMELLNVLQKIFFFLQIVSCWPNSSTCQKEGMLSS